jgi:hypothetical protein
VFSCALDEEVKFKEEELKELKFEKKGRQLQMAEGMLVRKGIF